MNARSCRNRPRESGAVRRGYGLPALKRQPEKGYTPVKNAQRQQVNRLKADLGELHRELRADLAKLLADHGHTITVDAVRLQDKVSKLETALFLLREV